MKTKKQITTRILLTFFFVCVFSACSGPDISLFKATQGVLDLKSTGTSSMGIVKLDGDWEFYWNKLLYPEDFIREPDTTSVRSGFIDLPGSWLKFKDTHIRTTDYGYATFRLVIEVSEDREWSIRVPVILTAYKLWVNGRLLASAGKVGTAREESRAGVYSPLIRFNSEGKKTELVLQISNFDDLWGGVNLSFTFGTTEYMQREYEKEFFVNTFCFGAILIFALYHFGLFAFRPKDYTTLLFGVFCSFMALCMTVFDTGLVMHFFPSFPWEIAKKTGFIVMNLGSAAFLFFVYFQYPKEVHRKIVLYPSLIFAACASLFVIIAPFRVYVRALFVFDIVLSLTFFYIIYVLITAVIKKREGAGIILAGYTVLALALANDILYTFDMIHTGFYIHIGLFIFIFAQGIVIALRNARVASKVEVLSRELGSYSKELEVKVAERTQQLEEANKQKTNYFVNMAHETKTPLTLILNYLDKDIRKRGTSDEIMLVKQSFDKLKRDMVNLLDLEKLSMGLTFYDHEQILNVSEALASKLTLFAEIARKKNIRLEKKLASGVYCKIDNYAFDRIVNNLVDNALRYTKSEGTVRVLLATEGEKFRLTVEDNGIGISPDQQETIFTPYRQVSSEKRSVQGIGIGLTIVKKIIDGLSGEIVLDSEPNRGTRLSIILLQSEPGAADAKNIEWSKPIEYNKIPPFEQNAEKGKPNILIVEDNQEMLSCLLNELKDVYNVYGAGSGREALSMIRRMEKPDAIVSDLMMDDIDGFELFDNLSKDEAFKCIPFIFITAKTTPDDKMKGLKGGAVDFIFKPFLIEELKLKLGSLIKVQAMQRDSYKKEIADKISSIFKDPSSEKNGTGNYAQLEKKIDEYTMSPKENKIVKLLLRGYEYKEISHMLAISINTLKPYINKIYKRFKVHNKVELINLIQENK